MGKAVKTQSELLYPPVEKFITSLYNKHIEVNDMKELTIEFIRTLSKQRKIKWTLHIIRKLQERGIYREDIYHAIENGQIIEQYPDDYPYPSCLLFGTDLKANPLHIVVGSDGTILFLITSYYPDSDSFEPNHITRKEN